MALEWRHENKTFDVRQIARCGKCKAVRSRLVQRTVKKTYRSDRIGPVSSHRSDNGKAENCNCGSIRPLFYRDVKGTKTDKSCGAKCMASKGPVCECACGGKNHGASYASQS